MDRANLSVAGASLSRDLQFSSEQLGWIFSAFGWAYAVLQIPGGWLVDRVKPRLLYTCCLVAWSAATMLQGWVAGFAALFALRLVTGAFEAPSYPINNRVVTGWIPENRRALAIAVYTSGQYVGLAFLQPLMVFIQVNSGWRGLFVITGMVGVLWGVAWYLLYRDPPAPTASGAPASGEASAPRTSVGQRLLEVCRHRKLWGIYVGQFAVASTLWFFLTWFPTYLEKYRGFSLAGTGWLRSVPFLAAFAGIILSGLLSDFLVRRGWSAGVARKTPVIAGLLLTTTIVGANYVDDPSYVILFLSLAFFGNGMASITWVFVSLLAPRHLIGLAGGVFNFCGNLSSIAVPIVIGHLVKAGNFAPALVFIATVAVMGVCSYVFVVGKIEPIEVAAKP
jgi:ACS family D-galactonate transporter-like MFS transporter